MKLKHPYCLYALSIAKKDDVDKVYHDKHYGVLIKDDDELFGRLIMEINQAGLSWRTILLKEKGFRKAYGNFSIAKIAKYKEKDVKRLLDDAGIIRNRLKVAAAIHNAKQIEKLQKEHGSFYKWLLKNKKEIGDDKATWLSLFKKHFTFVGGEIMGEFLMSISLLPGAHDKHCRHAKK